jgi:putative aldouronate transport system substrate-binding protein
MKRLSNLAILAFFIGSLAFAGGGKAASGGAAASGSGDLVELTWLVWNREITPPEQGDLNDNWWTRYVNEQVAPLGAKIKYVIIPRNQEDTLIATMLAAGDAPTFSYTYELDLLKTYINGGGVSDVTSLVDTYGTNVKSLYAQMPKGMDDFRIDGKLYYFPMLNNWIDARTTFIRKDWLDTLGLETPSTAEEFYQVLKTIKAKDPGKAGNALVPFALEGGIGNWDSVVLPGFVKTPPSPERFLTPYAMWPETKDALRWLNKLYNEGLMSDEFLVDDGGLFRQKIARGEIFAYPWSGHHPYWPGYGDLYKTLKQKTPDAVIASIDTFKQSKAGERMVFYNKNPMYEYNWFIPSSEKNLEIAVKVFNWMCSPACYKVAAYGVEGVDYRMVNGVVTPVDPEAYQSRVVSWIADQYNLMLQGMISEDRNVMILTAIKDIDPMFKDQLLKEARFLSEEKYFRPSLPGLTPIGDKLNPVLSEYWDNEFPKLIYGPASNFDARFDAVVKTYREMGGDRVAAEALELYNSRK